MGKNLMLVALLAVVIAQGWAAAGGDDSSGALDPAAVVERYQAAFNAHDVEGMLSIADEGVEWLSVSGTGCAAETTGKEALAKGMKEYFASLPSARSKIEEKLVSGSFVAVRERAYWKSGETEKSQAALAVYQIESGRVHRVWYFSAE